MREAARRWKRSVERALERWRYADLYRGGQGGADIEDHIREAAEWLKRAQDAGDDRGVSYGVRFGEGFLPSYPETTGYIIPTFLALSDRYREDDYLTRAVQMGDWEIQVQLDCGAVMGGRVDAPPSPAVFNTGMVMLGWLALYERTREPRFLSASQKAADWLVSVQEPDGRWVRGNSRFANEETTVYNTRVAWALVKHGVLTGDDRYTEAGVKNVEYALSRQRPNGWFADCCLTDASRPLLHTLAYATRGVLETGLLTGRDDFIAAARRSADSILATMGPDGFVPGRFDERFQPAVPWCCLTGSAQMAVVWARLHGVEKNDEKYAKALRRVNRYLMAHHDIPNNDPALRGGVPGSWPVWGDYGRLMILNWATKFLVDALLCERRLAERQ